MNVQITITATPERRERIKRDLIAIQKGVEISEAKVLNHKEQFSTTIATLQASLEAAEKVREIHLELNRKLEFHKINHSTTFYTLTFYFLWAVVRE